MNQTLTMGLTKLLAFKREAAAPELICSINEKIPLIMASYWRYNPFADTVSIEYRFNYIADDDFSDEYIHKVAGSLIGATIDHCRNESSDFYYTTDIKKEPIFAFHKNKDRVIKLGLAAFISIPIKRKARSGELYTSAVLNLYPAKDATFSNDDIHIIKHIFELSDQRQYLMRMQELTEDVMTGLSQVNEENESSALISVFSNIILKSMNVEAASLYEIGNRKNKYVLSCSTDDSLMRSPTEVFDFMGVGLIGSAAAARKPIVINDVSDLVEVRSKVRPEITEAELNICIERTQNIAKSILMCPIYNPATSRNEPPVAILKLTNKKCHIGKKTDTFSKFDLEKAEEICRLLAFYEERRRLENGRIAFALQFGHEAQAPSIGIKGSVGRLMRQKEKLSEEQKASILSNIDTFADLLISFSDSVTYGFSDEKLSFRTKYRIRQTNLRSIVDQAKRIVIPFCRLDNVAFDDIRISGSYPDIYVDERAFARVFYNLFTNSIKYRDRKSEFRVLVRCTNTSKLIQFHDRRKGGIVRLQQRGYNVDVTDFGVGFDAAYKEVIFGNGYRIPEHSAFEMRGSGIGLNVVRNILSDFGCQVHVQSNENPTIFRIFVPAFLESIEDVKSIIEYGGRL